MSKLHAYCDETKSSGKYILGFMLIKDSSCECAVKAALSEFGKEDRYFKYHAVDDLATTSRSKKTANDFIKFILNEIYVLANEGKILFARFATKSEKMSYESMLLYCEKNEWEVHFHRDRGSLERETQKIISGILKRTGFTMSEYNKKENSHPSRLIAIVDYILHQRLVLPGEKKK